MKVSTAEYLDILQALLPEGAAWPRDAEAVLTRLLEAWADEQARVHNRAVDLIDESDPRTTSEAIADWERLLGLPGACMVGLAQTLAARRDAAHTKLMSGGGQSRQFFIDLAAGIGFTVTITEFRPFQAGCNAGEPCADETWRFVWRINAPAETIRPFEAGAGQAGEALRNWGNELLECTINSRAPAHTNVLFAYGG